jgi:hypothetical protein
MCCVLGLMPPGVIFVHHSFCVSYRGEGRNHIFGWENSGRMTVKIYVMVGWEVGVPTAYCNL